MDAVKRIERARQVNDRRVDALTRVKRIIIERLNLGIEADHIDDDSPLFGMGLGLDSIDSLELVVGIEEEFGVQVGEEDLEVFLSVNTLVDYILQQGKKTPTRRLDLDDERLARMPWLRSYKALREGVLLFQDRPTILELEESGVALDFISWLVAGKDLLLEPNRAINSVLLDEEGAVVDLVTVMMFEDRYWFILPGSGRVGAEWILARAAVKGLMIQEVSQRYVQVGVEGPYSWKAVKPLAGFEVTGLSYLHFMNAEWDGSPVVIFRAGTANEYGFKIFVASGRGDDLAAFIREVAKGVDLHSEKDRANLEACFSVAMAEVRNPAGAAAAIRGDSPVPHELRWMVDAKKKEFIGRNAVLDMMTNFETRILCFLFDENPPVETIASIEAAPVKVADEEIGTVLSARWSPALDRWFGYARIRKEWAYAGNAEYEIAIDGRIGITTCSTPIFLTASATVQME